MSGKQRTMVVADRGCEIKDRLLCFTEMRTTREWLYFGRILVCSIYINVGQYTEVQNRKKLISASCNNPQ